MPQKTREKLIKRMVIIIFVMLDWIPLRPLDFYIFRRSSAVSGTTVTQNYGAAAVRVHEYICYAEARDVYCKKPD